VRRSSTRKRGDERKGGMTGHKANDGEIVGPAIKQTSTVSLQSKLLERKAGGLKNCGKEIRTEGGSRNVRKLYQKDLHSRGSSINSNNIRVRIRLGRLGTIVEKDFWGVKENLLSGVRAGTYRVKTKIREPLLALKIDHSKRKWSRSGWLFGLKKWNKNIGHNRTQSKLQGADVR